MLFNHLVGKLVSLLKLVKNSYSGTCNLFISQNLSTNQCSFLIVCHISIHVYICHFLCLTPLVMAVYLWLHIDFLSSSGGNSIAVDYRLTLRLPAQQERDLCQLKEKDTHARAHTNTRKSMTGWENAAVFLTV